MVMEKMFGVSVTVHGVTVIVEVAKLPVVVEVTPMAEVAAEHRPAQLMAMAAMATGNQQQPLHRLRIAPTQDRWLRRQGVIAVRSQGGGGHQPTPDQPEYTQDGAESFHHSAPFRFHYTPESGSRENPRLEIPLPAVGIIYNGASSRKAIKIQQQIQAVKFWHRQCNLNVFK